MSGAPTQNDPQVQIICITWKIVVLTLHWIQNLSLSFLSLKIDQVSETSKAIWFIWPKMQITAFRETQIERVGKVFRNALIDNGLHEKGSNP